MVTHSIPKKYPVFETTVPLDVFEQFVNECARLHLDQPIANSCPYHARYVIAKLFELARKEVCLVSDGLLHEDHNHVELYTYPPIMENADRFLSRDPNAVFSIIVRANGIERGEQNEFLSKLINSKTRVGTVELYVPQVDLLDSHVHHFIVVDNLLIRSESSKAPKDKDEPIGALANFGNAKDAQDLRLLFSQLLSYLKQHKDRVRNYTFPRGRSFSLD